MPRTYVSQILCFPATNPGVFERLKDGLHGVIKDVPYLLSGVEDSDDPKGAVRLTRPCQNPDELITWQDLSANLDYDALKKSNFPPAALTAPGIRPPSTLAPFPSPEPVFRAKLSLINGGVLLCVAVHHNTTDITGLGALLGIWASHCRLGSSADVAPDRSWYDRSVLLGLPAATAIGEPKVPELIHVVKKDEQARPVRAAPTSRAFETRVFHFPPASLHELKTSVNRHVSTSTDTVGWVSTGDILTAVLWSAAIWAEQSNHDGRLDGDDICTAGIPVNFRSRFNPVLPPNYLGAAFAMTVAAVPRSELLSLSTDNVTASSLRDGYLAARLARIASAIRASLYHVDHTRVGSALGHISSQTDITAIKLGPRHEGISLVSWADEGVHELDWGEALGRCDAVRLPKMAGKRYPIVLPRLAGTSGNGGGFEVIASFDEGTMERFCQNRLIHLLGTLRC